MSRAALFKDCKRCGRLLVRHHSDPRNRDGMRAICAACMNKNAALKYLYTRGRLAP